jgi:acyl homoserine lactone synthase
MIKLITAANAANYQFELDGMYQLRARIFADRMKWPVEVVDGRERDAFDSLNPLYIVGVQHNRVVSSARLLPTTGPNMLGDVFSDLLPPNGEIASPLIWESSRFCVDTDTDATAAKSGVNAYTAELLCGIIETGINAGLEFIVSVVDVSIERVLRNAGCRCERLGQPRRIGQSLAIAGMFPMTHELLSAVRTAGGIEGSVIAPSTANTIKAAA